MRSETPTSCGQRWTRPSRRLMLLSDINMLVAVVVAMLTWLHGDINMLVALATWRTAALINMLVAMLTVAGT